MQRYYTAKAVRNAKGQYQPKTFALVTPDPAFGESLNLVAPLQDMGTGALLHSWYFVLADLRDHTLLLADPDHTALPDMSLDAKWGAINVATRTQFKATLPTLGFSQAEINAIDASDGYREVVRAVGRKLQSGFNENRFEVMGA